MFPISTVGHSKVKLAISSFSCPGYPGTDTSEPQLFHEISRSYGVLRRPTASYGVLRRPTASYGPHKTGQGHLQPHRLTTWSSRCSISWRVTPGLPRMSDDIPQKKFLVHRWVLVLMVNSWVVRRTPGLTATISRSPPRIAGEAPWMVRWRHRSLGQRLGLWGLFNEFHNDLVMGWN